MKGLSWVKSGERPRSSFRHVDIQLPEILAPNKKQLSPLPETVTTMAEKWRKGKKRVEERTRGLLPLSCGLLPSFSLIHVTHRTAGNDWEIHPLPLWPSSQKSVVSCSLRRNTPSGWASARWLPAPPGVPSVSPHPQPGRRSTSTHSQLLLQRLQLLALPLGRARGVRELREAVQGLLQLGDFLRHLVYLARKESSVSRQERDGRSKTPPISQPVT